MRPSALRRFALPAALASIVLFDISCGNDSGSPSPTPTDVIVTPGADTLISVGQTRAFTAQVVDANGHPIDAATVTWSSTAPGVLSIDPSTGVATAVGNGAAQVQATAGLLHGAANVIVQQIVATVTVTPANAAFTAVGDTARFTAVAKDGGGTPVVGVQILWSISDNTVATIDTLGLAKSKGPGNALVSAQAQTRAGYAAIGVDPSVTQFAILSAPTTAVAGEPGATALTVELRDVNGNRVMSSSLAVTVAPAGAATGTPLHGATNVLADQGRATFNNLWFERAGIDRFKVSVAALPTDSASLVTVVPGPPGRVRLDSIATFHVAGVPIGLTARVEDRFGNLAGNYNGPVVATPALAPDGNPTFFGDTETVAVAGVAPFSTLNFHFAGGPWRFTALVPGIPTVRDTTRVMGVVPGPPSTFVLDHQGKVGMPGAFIDSTVIVVSDAFGNTTSGDSLGDTLSVHLATTGWPYSSYYLYAQDALFTLDAPLVDGHATFDVVVRRPGATRLIFSMPGFTPDTTAPIVPLLPAPLLVNVSATVQAPLMLTDRATCFLNYITYCAGADDHGVLGVDSSIVPLDSLWNPTDSTPGGSPVSGDGGDRHVCGGVGDFYTGLFHVVCWGDNAEGQLGGGPVGGESSTPVVVAGFTATAAPEVAAGGAHSCALFDGAAACWGKNDVGQLGTGSTGASTGTAATVVGGHLFGQISAGARHTCAIDDAHKLWCWGADDLGQLGDSGVLAPSSATPVEVRADLIWNSVTAGDDFTCGAVQQAGFNQIYCWGNNAHLILGPDFTSDTLAIVPVLAQQFDGSTNGVFAGAGYACATISDALFGQKVQCWGANDHGQLGRGTISAAESDAASPAPVDGFHDIILPVLGRNHACALTTENAEFVRQVICWGDNSYGRMGIGRTGGDEPTPINLQAQY